MKVRIATAAQLMGKGEQFIRVGLQRGLLPFGAAQKMPGSRRWSYIIYPGKLAQYLGMTTGELESRLEAEK